MGFKDMLWIVSGPYVVMLWFDAGPSNKTKPGLLLPQKARLLQLLARRAQTPQT
ncbi:MAG TPA: hypothetical protein VFW38_02940 [Solirubrobacteraceae bacterium]|nr:hypothetical protein [Solirubrobacteraceae bacterium]